MIHLVKLCVGVATAEELLAWRAQRFGRPDGLNYHRTRMSPKRRDEIIGQGSLYWVMSGVIRCRQKIVDLVEVTDHEGRGACDILMDPELIMTVPQPKRPFQGWRYLRPEDAPADLTGTAPGDESQLTDDLAKLGLL